MKRLQLVKKKTPLGVQTIGNPLWGFGGRSTRRLNS